jgi:hypothetical protein
MPAWMVPAALAGAQFIGNKMASRSAQKHNRRGVQQASGYLNQIEPVARNTLSPYIEGGHQAERDLPFMYRGMYDEYANNAPPEEYGNMSSDPTQFINDIMRGYTPSEGYKYKEKRMTDAARATGAAGGFAGTELDRESQADMIRGLLGGDIQEFLNNVMGTQRYGLEGRERYNERNMLGKERANALSTASRENRANRGFMGATDLANILGSNLGQQAGLGIMGNRQSQTIRNEANRNNMDMFGRMMDMYQGGSFGNMGNRFGGR